MSGRLIVALVLCALAYAAWPWLSLATYAMRLATMPAPASVAVPVQAIPARALRDTWHAARSSGRRHEGIDIFAERGTPVIAATEGIVLRRAETAIGGKVVWVLGPGAQHHYYAHLDGYSEVTAGQRVQPGTPLGFVGNSGNARNTPPHLHYGIYGADGAINPYPLLTKKSPQKTGAARTAPATPG